MQFKGPRAQGQDIFCDFIILLESSYDSGENEVLFVKVGAKVPKLWLDTSGPKWPKFSLQVTDPKGKVCFKIS